MKHLRRFGIGLLFFGAVAGITGIVLLAILHPLYGLPIMILGAAYAVGSGIDSDA